VPQGDSESIQEAKEMTGWGGFWIMIGLIEIADAWRFIRMKELELKYPKFKFKWYEHIF
jgi:hypothetical protein